MTELGQLAFGYVVGYGSSGFVYIGYPGVGGLPGTTASLFRRLHVLALRWIMRGSQHSLDWAGLGVLRFAVVHLSD